VFEYDTRVWFTAAAAVVLAICLGWCSVARAHELYPVRCGGGRDCWPVACAEVGRTVRGWNWHGLEFGTFNYMSPDERCHVCVARSPLGEDYTLPRCIFLPPGLTA
jgi:hypothetical protein